MMKLLRLMLQTVLALAGLAALWLAAGVFWPVDVPVPNTRAPRLLLTNVSIVDVERGRVVEGQRVLVVNGEIAGVGDIAATDGMQVVDGGGHYAIPGLFDMHVHSFKLAPVLTHPLFVAAGVTAVRDMGGCIGIDDAWVACAEDKRAWNGAVRAGRMVGPRYDQITSLALNGGSEIPLSVEPQMGGATEQGARARVRYDAGRGIDFLKPYNDLPRESYLALAAAARENGLYLAGHLPLGVTGLEAVAAGQRSIEHAVLFVWECYPGMAELRSADAFWRRYDGATRLRMIDEHDPVACEALRSAMMDSGMAFVPTHTTRKLDAFAADPDYRGDRRLRYIPAPLRTLWLQDADAMAERGRPDNFESYRAIYEFGLAQTGAAHDAGVTVLAGSDAPDSFVFPGTGLHDELEHLVAAGLSPLEALRTATVEPARFLGLDGKAGTIAPGARADIVLLQGNPLSDIGAVRTVAGVVLAGSYYDRGDLDVMLEDVEAAAGSWSVWPKFVWQLLNSPIMRRQFAD